MSIIDGRFLSPERIAKMQKRAGELVSSRAIVAVRKWAPSAQTGIKRQMELAVYVDGDFLDLLDGAE